MVDGLRFSIDYNHNRSDDTANSLPLLTPEIEAAFPDRVTRDGAGNLIAIDQRPVNFDRAVNSRSEEHTSELQSLMRISYAVFCLKKKNRKHTSNKLHTQTE